MSEPERNLESDVCDVDGHDHHAVVTDVSARLSEDGVYEGAADLFGAFADSNRLRIMDALRAADELCVSDLMEITAMSQSAVSHALKLLRLRRLVVRRREGRHVYYRLLDEHVVKLIEFALEHLAEE